MRRKCHNVEWLTLQHFNLVVVADTYVRCKVAKKGTLRWIVGFVMFGLLHAYRTLFFGHTFALCVENVVWAETYASVARRRSMILHRDVLAVV